MRWCVFQGLVDFKENDRCLQKVRRIFPCLFSFQITFHQNKCDAVDLSSSKGEFVSSETSKTLGRKLQTWFVAFTLIIVDSSTPEKFHQIKLLPRIEKISICLHFSSYRPKHISEKVTNKIIRKHSCKHSLSRYFCYEYRNTFYCLFVALKFNL